MNSGHIKFFFLFSTIKEIKINSMIKGYQFQVYIHSFFSTRSLFAVRNTSALYLSVFKCVEVKITKFELKIQFIGFIIIYIHIYFIWYVLSIILSYHFKLLFFRFKVIFYIFCFEIQYSQYSQGSSIVQTIIYVNVSQVV